MAKYTKILHNTAADSNNKASCVYARATYEPKKDRFVIISGGKSKMVSLNLSC
jgi:hypothetical protein